MDKQLRDYWPGWETVRLIGRGSFGAVYEIQREIRGRTEHAALKVISIPRDDNEIYELKADGYDDESITQYFADSREKIEDEYAMMADLKGHSNVVYCDDIRTVQHDDGFGWDIYIKMELLTPLKSYLGESASEAQIIKLGLDICDALILCEELNIVHRDIKPENIFVSRDGNFKLGDFGIAKTMEGTTGGTKTGTYDYMAPEVYNNRPYHTQADIYSLGLVMYWLMNNRTSPFLLQSGRRPTPSEKTIARDRRFSGEKLPAPRDGSETLRQIVLKACAFVLKDRYQSAREMREELLRFSGGQVYELAHESIHFKNDENLDLQEGTVGPVFKKSSVENETEEKSVDPVFKKDTNDDLGKTVGPNFKPRYTYDVADAEKTVGPVFVAGNQHNHKGISQNGKTQTNKSVPASIRKRNMGIALVFVAFWIFIFGIVYFAGKESEYSDSKTKPMMMADPLADELYAEDYLYDDSARVLGSDTPRSQIRAIIFLDTLKDAPDDSWDVSAAQNGSVLAWVKNSEELYIAGKGGVTAPKNCRGLFAWYDNLLMINFNNCFVTDQTTDMSYMFGACHSLETVDVSVFDTSAVTNMSYMFGGCNELASLDVSGFNTAHVTDMSYMFAACRSLTSLVGTGFDTSNVTNMSYMFYYCPGLFVWNDPMERYEALHLDISNFNVERVTDWENFIWIDDQPCYIDNELWERFFFVHQEKHIVKVVAGEVHNVALYSDGTVKSSGLGYHGEDNVEDWHEIIDICATEGITVGLKRDGTVVAVGNNTNGQCNVSDWTDISAIAASGYNVIGVKQDGTVVAVGNNDYGQCNVNSWTGIVQADIGTTHSVGLRADGTVVATGDNEYGQCNVSEWTDIVSVKVAYLRTIGLKADGTVVATGGNFDGECNVSSWTDIVAIDTDGNHTVGLKSDGTVVAAGFNSWESYGACDVSKWTDIIYVEVGYYRTIGMKSDGTIVVTGWNDRGQCDIGELNLQ